jgi:hypothetical protein
MQKMTDKQNQVSRKGNTLDSMRKCARCLVWLPWFLLTWTWQIRRAQDQVLAVIDFRGCLNIDEDTPNQGKTNNTCNFVQPEEKAKKKDYLKAM